MLTKRRAVLLPSVNMLDGNAKQFDDGLYAELDAGMTFGKMSAFNDTSSMLEAILVNLDPGSEAYAWVWGGLKIGIDDFPAENHAPKPKGAQRFIDDFERDEVESKPICFYTWSDELDRTFRMLCYFQRGWSSRDGVPDGISRALAANPDILKQYRTLLDFYANLTDPFDALSFIDLADTKVKGKTSEKLWKEKGLAPKPDGATVHLLPCSTSREVELFNKLFGGGLPPGTDLMMEVVKAIRDGRVDLTPNENSGWYDYQVFALETFLLPERGSEYEKLLLTKKYKERMLQAFKALVTKRRETHVRQLSRGKEESAPATPFFELAPRLRVEPNPTYYLRTAWAYSFLQTYLEATVPEYVMERLLGRREGCTRELPLLDELEYMRKLFYGFHLVSFEDIGMWPDLLEGELDGIPGGASGCMVVTLEWLEAFADDPDLAIDTRVSVPIFVSLTQNKTTLWCTLGVHGAKLRVWYARSPMWRPKDSVDGQWGDPERQGVDLIDILYIILVDESAEVELDGFSTLTREEFRDICDKYHTKDDILQALSD